MIQLLFFLCIIQAGAVMPEQPGDLPEFNDFLNNVTSNLRSDRFLQIQYTYTLKETEFELDKEGDIRKTEVKEYEVYPFLEEDQPYRRLLSKNGIPLSPEAIEKQDREYDKKYRERQKQLDEEDADNRARRLSGEAEEKRKEDAIVAELPKMYDITMKGRETIDGHAAILLHFKPRPDYKPLSKETKILSKFAGRAWFCEKDYQLIRLNVDLIDTLSFGIGMLARVHKGANITFHRRRINNEVWLPAEAHFSGTARVLLLKKVRIKTSSEFSNYKKFTVDTSIRYGAELAP